MRVHAKIVLLVTIQFFLGCGNLEFSDNRSEADNTSDIEGLEFVGDIDTQNCRRKVGPFASGGGGCTHLPSQLVFGPTGKTGVTFAQAQRFCANASQSGYTDWRLPSALEAEKFAGSCKDSSRAIPRAGEFGFTNQMRGKIWSSEDSYRGKNELRYLVSVCTGAKQGVYVAGRYYSPSRDMYAVTCVRSLGDSEVIAPSTGQTSANVWLQGLVDSATQSSSNPNMLNVRLSGYSAEDSDILTGSNQKLQTSYIPVYLDNGRILRYVDTGGIDVPKKDPVNVTIAKALLFKSADGRLQTLTPDRLIGQKIAVRGNYRDADQNVDEVTTALLLASPKNGGQCAVNLPNLMTGPGGCQEVGKKIWFTSVPRDNSDKKSALVRQVGEIGPITTPAFIGLAPNTGNVPIYTFSYQRKTGRLKAARICADLAAKSVNGLSTWRLPAASELVGLLRRNGPDTYKSLLPSFRQQGSGRDRPAHEGYNGKRSFWSGNFPQSKFRARIVNAIDGTPRNTAKPEGCTGSVQNRNRPLQLFEDRNGCRQDGGKFRRHDVICVAD